MAGISALMSLAVFSNMRISNEIRLEIFKESFLALSKASVDKWYINIRGKHKKEASEFLVFHLGTKLELFDLETEKNWHKTSRKMLNCVNEQAIFYWIEDHILQVKPEVFNQIVANFLSSNCDYLQYSFWGLGTHFKEFSTIKKKKDFRYFERIEYGLTENCLRQKVAEEIYGKNAYIVSLAGLFSYDFFKNNLNSRRIFPLRRWPKNTPFDFERGPDDVWFLPFTVAVPKLEISCSVDDDNPVDGASLISRGLFNLKFSREEILLLEGRKSSPSTFKHRLKSTINKIPIFPKLIKLAKRLSYYF